MTSVYHRLAADYHLLFPARPAQIGFLRELVGGPPTRLLDVASGTGEYVDALDRQGYECRGVELDDEMHRVAAIRHPQLAAAGRLIRGDMRQLDRLASDPVDLAYCIGNSLAHLDSDDEVAGVLRSMWGVTRPAGTVAVQVANFDRILSRLNAAGEHRLPILTAKREDGGDVRFEREYRAVHFEDRGLNQGKVRLHACLSLPEGAFRTHWELLALTQGRIGAALPPGAHAQWYGDFGGSPWETESPATIAVLR